MVDPGLQRLVEDLRGDHERGASELARGAVEALAVLAEKAKVDDAQELEVEAETWSRALRSARPTMAAIAGLVDRWRESARARPGESLADFRKRLRERAGFLVRESRKAIDKIAAEAAAAISDSSTIITLSRSSTVAAVFGRLQSRGVEAIIAESRPVLEGHRLAEELDRMAIPVQLVTDAQLGHFTAAADIALVGADAILADGAVVNKVGTYLLALAAREADVPFWVCSESFKRSRLRSDVFPLEEMNSADLQAPGLVHGRARNVAFEITPASLVTRWIDEGGSTFGRPRSETRTAPVDS